MVLAAQDARGNAEPVAEITTDIQRTQPAFHSVFGNRLAFKQDGLVERGVTHIGLGEPVSAPTEWQVQVRLQLGESPDPAKNPPLATLGSEIRHPRFEVQLVITAPGKVIADLQPATKQQAPQRCIPGHDLEARLTLFVGHQVIAERVISATPKRRGDVPFKRFPVQGLADLLAEPVLDVFRSPARIGNYAHE